MHLNLYDYICSPLGQASLPHNSIIISDLNITSDHIYHPLSVLFQDDSVKNIKQHVVIIIDRYTTQDILMGTLPPSHTIINLNPGITSMQEKHHEQSNDITTMLGRHYSIYEPVNTEHLLKLITQPHTYIRLFDTPLASSLATYSYTHGITKIQGEYVENDLTIISNISIVDTMASVVHRIHKHTSHKINHFTLSYYDQVLAPDVIESISKSERCVICVDHKATEEFRLYREELITRSCDIKPLIHYIFPQFHMVSTMLREYRDEEAKFDHESIAGYIMDILPATEYSNSLTFDLGD